MKTWERAKLSKAYIGVKVRLESWEHVMLLGSSYALQGENLCRQDKRSYIDLRRRQRKASSFFFF